MTECIDTVGFIFSKVKTLIKCDSKKKYTVNQSCLNTQFYSYKICQFKLTKDNFMSSTLYIATNKEDAWNSFRASISNLIDAYFVISLTKNNIANSFNATLVRVKKCDCCDAIILYFKYNIIPYTNIDQCYQKPITQYTLGYDTICCPTTPSNQSQCIMLNSYSPIPNVQCFPSNYWPSPSTEDAYKVCCNTAGNFTYDKLKSGVYSDVKFFVNDKYCYTPCFTKCLN